MWRPWYKLVRNATLSSVKENKYVSNFFHSSRHQSRSYKSPMKITLIGASVGLVVGAGYGGYTHYLVNSKKSYKAVQYEDYAFLDTPPEYNPHYKIINEQDNSNLKLVLFQYRTCPFCCKVRAYLDSRGISYEVVEVDAVLRQAIKWSSTKKVPIVLAKVDGGYQQLIDSTAIISILETYLRDKSVSLKDIIKYYPSTRFTNDEGKSASEIANKYFVMYNAPITNELEKTEEQHERQWRKWADEVLVHTLSPNVYRTFSEAIETFKWFEEAGGWRQNFPSWECALMVYGGATAMWVISKRLKKRHNIPDDARQALYAASNDWMAAVKKKGSIFFGGDQPNLADVTVYGVLSSMEGCRAFQDLRANSDIGNWYDQMKSILETRRGKVNSAASLQSVTV